MAVEILGFGVSIFIYASLLAILILYIVSGLRKKYNFANGLLLFFFLHNLFTIAILSWSLVVMNNGFDIIFNSNDFSWVLLVIIPIIIIYPIIDFKIRRNIPPRDTFIKKTYRFTLPILTILLFVIATLLFCFNINYFIFLINW